MTDHFQKSNRAVRTVVNDLREKYVTLERDRELRIRLDELLDCDDDGNPIPKPAKYTSTGETRGLLVLGEAGSGKSTAVERMLRKHEALQPSETRKPCISIEVPNPATMKSVGREILAAAGIGELSGNPTAWEIWRMIRHRFKLLGTVVLFIDEAHDLFPAKASSEAAEILKTLKSMTQGDSAVIVIRSGLPRLRNSIAFDYQVERRYSKLELPPMSTAGDAKMLWHILRGFCDRAGLEMPERGDLIERLMHAARQRFGLCIEQMINAIQSALIQGDWQLDVQHFAEVFHRQEACSVGENVFLVPRWAAIDLRSSI